MAADEAGVVEEDGEWGEAKASTPAGNETLTDTAATTNRELDAAGPMKRNRAKI